jgi:hypothetical protein
MRSRKMPERKRRESDMEEWIDTPESSTIARVGYDPDTMVLVVEFQKTGVYHYYDVPQAVFDAMRIAGSKGQYLAQNVKGTYRYARA